MLFTGWLDNLSWIYQELEANGPRPSQQTNWTGCHPTGAAGMFLMAGFSKLSGNPQMVGLFDAIG